jgi:hypothetical protein
MSYHHSINSLIFPLQLENLIHHNSNYVFTHRKVGNYQNIFYKPINTDSNLNYKLNPLVLIN